jgi:poly(A) polymerase
LRERRALIYRMGNQTFFDRALLAWARERDIDPRTPAASSEGWTELLRQALEIRIPEFPLKGRDVLALGLPHGPRIGQALESVQRWWEEQDFQPGRLACLERLKAIPESQIL